MVDVDVSTISDEIAAHKLCKVLRKAMSSHSKKFESLHKKYLIDQARYKADKETMKRMLQNEKFLEKHLDDLLKQVNELNVRLKTKKPMNEVKPPKKPINESKLPKKPLNIATLSVSSPSPSAKRTRH